MGRKKKKVWNKWNASIIHDHSNRPKQTLRLPQNGGAPNPTEKASSKEQITAFYASWGWKRLSYEVKMERGRKCECCGATAPQVRIITDHIKPLRKYWNLRLKKFNLQVLCEDCNMGKGSHDETDFRVINAANIAPLEPEISDDESERLEAIREQLRLN